MFLLLFWFVPMLVLSVLVIGVHLVATLWPFFLGALVLGFLVWLLR